MNQIPLQDWASKAASPSVDAEWMRFVVWVALVTATALTAMSLGQFPGWKIPFLVAGAIGAAAASTHWFGPIADAPSLGRVSGASTLATLLISAVLTCWNP